MQHIDAASSYQTIRRSPADRHIPNMEACSIFLFGCCIELEHCLRVGDARGAIPIIIRTASEVLKIYRHISVIPTVSSVAKLPVI